MGGAGMENSQTTCDRVALKFASALVNGDFDEAHQCQNSVYV
jgi:hypothetical protein